MTWFEHDLSKVIEQIQIGVGMTLPNGAIEYANLNMRKMLDFSVERILGVNLTKFKSGMQIMNVGC